MNSVVEENIGEIIKPVIESMGYEYVGSEYTAQGRFSVLSVYINKTDGVTADDCRKVSHQIGAILDVEEPIKGQYRLEVSSPGLDRPLFGLEDFKKFIGKNVKIHLSSPLDNQKNFTGLIKSVDQNTVLVLCDSEKFVLPIEQIAKANLIPEIYKENRTK